jgi:hypothetical protein
MMEGKAANLPVSSFSAAGARLGTATAYPRTVPFNPSKRRLHMLAIRFRNVMTMAVFTAFAFTASAALADEAKVPQTAADHEALAKQYKDQAAQFKKVADEHRAMADAYKKSFAAPAAKAGQKNPWVVKMEKHCGMLAKDADKLAADAEKAAEFHLMRAKEVEGK